MNLGEFTFIKGLVVFWVFITVLRHLIPLQSFVIFINVYRLMQEIIKISNWIIEHSSSDLKQAE